MSGTRVPLLAAFLLSASCRTAQLADRDVYHELLDCGAMGYYGGGDAEVVESEGALAEARKMGDKPWLTCIYDGGLPRRCGAPCTR